MAGDTENILNAVNGEEFLENIFASIQDGISILDKNLTIIRVNPTMEKWYAHNMPVAGKKCYEIYHNRKEHCEVCPTLHSLQENKPAHEVVPKGGLGVQLWGG